jgi:hypothetical protein
MEVIGLNQMTKGVQDKQEDVIDLKNMRQNMWQPSALVVLMANLSCINSQP